MNRWFDHPDSPQSTNRRPLAGSTGHLGSTTMTNAIQCQLSVTSYPQLVAGHHGFRSKPDFKWEMAEGRVVCRWCVVSRSGAGTLVDFKWQRSDDDEVGCAWIVAGCKGPSGGNN